MATLPSLQGNSRPEWRDETTGRVYCIDLEYYVANFDLLEHSASEDESCDEYLQCEAARLPPIAHKAGRCKASPSKFGSEFGTDFGTHSTCVSISDLKFASNCSDLKFASNCSDLKFASNCSDLESYSHDYIIETGDLQLCDRIGKGRTGVVWKGHMTGCDKDVAIKQIPTRCSADKVLLYFGEISALQSSPHPNIVHMMGVTLGHSVHLVSEYCAGGSCFDLFHSSKPVTDMQAGKILVDVAEAMSHLHSLSPRLLHRNLTSRNVLLVQPITLGVSVPHAKVSDFNLACLVSGSVAERPWMAPEVIDNGLYSEKADVYSYAIFMYEVLYRKMPFEDIDTSSLSSFISDGLRPRLGEAASAVTSLMNAGWASRPSSRPSFRNIANTLMEVPAFGRRMSI